MQYAIYSTHKYNILHIFNILNCKMHTYKTFITLGLSNTLSCSKHHHPLSNLERHWCFNNKKQILMLHFTIYTIYSKSKLYRIFKHWNNWNKCKTSFAASEFPIQILFPDRRLFGPLHLTSSNAARHHSCRRLWTLSHPRQPSLKRAGAGGPPWGPPYFATSEN